MNMQTREIHLKRRPVGLPGIQDFELVSVRLPAPAPGQLLVRNTWMSVDPYMRGRMDERESFMPPFQIGHALDGAAVGVVEQANAPGFAVGDRVVHFTGWREHALIDAAAATRLNDDAIPPQTYLSALGFPGLTAYAGLVRVAQAKAGETIFVSAASGAVGSMVAQLARLKGLRVVASVGSAEKADWLLNCIGVAAVINYREAGDLTAALAAAAPEGIDIYFDNVGGEHLDAALAVAKPGARFVLCGMIAGYNVTRPSHGIRNLYSAVEKRIRLQGLLGADHFDLQEELVREVGRWVKSGELQVRETVTDGLENAPQAFIGLFSGANTGKMLVRLSRD